MDEITQLLIRHPTWSVLVSRTQRGAWRIRIRPPETHDWTACITDMSRVMSHADEIGYFLKKGERVIIKETKTQDTKESDA